MPHRGGWSMAVAGFVIGCAGGRAPAPVPPPLAPPPGEAPPVAWPAHVISVGGTSLHYVEAGSGIPLIFVHGSVGSFASWRAQIDSFARHYRVISYSRRFHPPNRALAEGGQTYALARHADDLALLIEGLQLERVHIVASSYGAYTALVLALKRPELVRSLVLGEPPLLSWLSRSPTGDSLRRDFEREILAAVRAAFARGDSVGALRRFVDGVGGLGRFNGLPPAARRELLRMAFELRLEMHAAPETYMPALSCREVGGLWNPVLLVTGERSPRLFHVITDELERCLVTEERVSVPGAGHAMHAGNPVFYNVAVLRFLASH